MATDPTQLIYSLLGAGGAIGQSFAQGRQNVADVANAQQENQIRGAQFQAWQQQQQDAQAQENQYRNDVAAWTAGGAKPQGLTDLIAKYPDRYKALQAGYAAKDDVQTKDALGFWGSLHGYLDKNDNKGAAALVNQRLAAEKAAGIDTTEEQQLADSLASGDATSIAGLKAAALAHVAAATGPDKFADAYGTVNKADEAYTLTPGARRYDAKNNLVASAPSSVHYEKIQTTDENGQPVTQVVAVGGEGGDPASGTSGASNGSGAPARRFGWTPRGPNSDAAVNGKLQGMTSALGVGVDTPFPAGMSNMQIAQALALSEGGAGSLADRNNNPANLTDPRTGQYRKFDTKQAGLAAAAAQVARNRARGQNSIRSMVEGLPVGGAQGGGTAQGGARVLYSATNPQAGASLDDDTVSTMAQQYLAGDKTVFANLGRGKQGSANIVKLRQAITQQAKAQGMSGAQIAQQMQTFNAAQKTLNAFDAGKEGGITRSLNVAIDHLDTLQNAAQALQNGSTPIFNKVSQAYARATGKAAPTNFEATRQLVAGEVAKVIAGGSSALSDRKELADNIATSASPEQLAGYIAQTKALLAGQLHGLAQQYQTGTGRNDFGSRLSARTRMALGYGQQQQRFTHMSASGKYGWNGSQWVAVH